MDAPSSKSILGSEIASVSLWTRCLPTRGVYHSHGGNLKAIYHITTWLIDRRASEMAAACDSSVEIWSDAIMCYLHAAFQISLTLMHAADSCLPLKLANSSTMTSNITRTYTLLQCGCVQSDAKCKRIYAEIIVFGAPANNYLVHLFPFASRETSCFQLSLRWTYFDWVIRLRPTFLMLLHQAIPTRCQPTLLCKEGNMQSAL